MIVEMGGTVSKADETSDISGLLFSEHKPHPIDKFVGERVKHYRKRKKLTQTELGNQLNLTFQQIQKYEKGSNRIGASRLYLLSKLLEIPVYKLFEGIELQFDTPGVTGFAETSGAEYKANPIRPEERQELLAAFVRIQDHSTRKRIIDLIKAIGHGAGERDD